MTPRMISDATAIYAAAVRIESICSRAPGTRAQCLPLLAVWTCMIGIEYAD